MSDDLAAGWMREGLLPYTIGMIPAYRVGEMHRLIAEKLEAVERGEIKRLMINTPPRHGKSLLTSEMFPAWYLGRNPGKQIIHITYGQDLADGFGRKVRNQLKDDKFRFSFPECEISEDSQAAKAFNTKQGGVYYAVGVGGAVTGRGADCLVAGTKIQTNQGLVSIENLENRLSSCKILTCDVNTGKLSYEQAQAFRRSQGVGIYRITTSSGRVVESTADHRFYVCGKGYIQAHKLTSGDLLLCDVQKEFREASLRGEQSAICSQAQRFLLQFGLQSGSSFFQESKEVHSLQSTNGKQREKVLRSMPTYSHQGWQESIVSRKTGNLPYLSGWLQGSVARQWEVSSLLFDEVQSSWSFKQNAPARQPEVEGWRKSNEDSQELCSFIPQTKATHIDSRQPQVCSLQSERYSDGSSSHRWSEHKQQSIESGVVVCEVPQRSAPDNGLWAGYDRVELVERIREKDTVYDIQVAKNHNFFANGVLVHNCLLIDDPIRNRQDAESKTIRQNLMDFYRSTAFTRLMPGGAIVIIQTRWHPEDLSGQLLETEGDQWEVINLPAIAEENDILGRSVGEALWPDQFDERALEGIKYTIGEREFASLYQQRPVPISGNLVKREWFKYDKTPAGAPITLGVDLAISQKETADYTAICALARDSFGKVYIKDVVRDRLPFHAVLNLIEQMAVKHNAQSIAIEQVQFQAAVIEELMRTTTLPIKAVRPDRDKLSRFQPLLVRYEQGLVYHDQLPSWFEDELLQFPMGAHDDIVDACSYAFLAHDGLSMNKPVIRQSAIYADADCGY